MSDSYGPNAETEARQRMALYLGSVAGSPLVFTAVYFVVFMFAEISDNEAHYPVIFGSAAGLLYLATGLTSWFALRNLRIVRLSSSRFLCKRLYGHSVFTFKGIKRIRRWSFATIPIYSIDYFGHFLPRHVAGIGFSSGKLYMAFVAHCSHDVLIEDVRYEEFQGSQ